MAPAAFGLDLLKADSAAWLTLGIRQDLLSSKLRGVRGFQARLVIRHSRTAKAIYGSAPAGPGAFLREQGYAYLRGRGTGIQLPQMQLDPHAIHVYTDGSCYRNPGGVSGCAAIVCYPDHMLREDEQILDFGCAESTNNRMELLACIRVLRWIRENAPWSGVSRVQVITDSLYVTQNIDRKSTR